MTCTMLRTPYSDPSEIDWIEVTAHDARWR